MSYLIRSPRDFIFRAMRDFRTKNPHTLFMSTTLLAEQLKLPESQLEAILTQLHEAGMIEFHPGWPLVKEASVPELS